MGGGEAWTSASWRRRLVTGKDFDDKLAVDCGLDPPSLTLPSSSASSSSWMT